MAKDIQVNVDEANISRIAPLRLANIGINKIAEQLKLTKHYVTKIVNSSEFSTKLREISDDMTSQAANSWKASISNLVPQAVDVLKQALEKGDLEAVKLIVRSLGVEKQETQVQQGNIQVILPDFSNSNNNLKDIDIEVTDD